MTSKKDPPADRRPRRTRAEIAQQAFEAADRKVVRLSQAVDRIGVQYEQAVAELGEARDRRDYLAEDPVLKHSRNDRMAVVAELEEIK